MERLSKKNKIKKWLEEKQKPKKVGELQKKPGEKKSDKKAMLNRLKNAVTNVLPGNPLSRDFDIQAQVASAGPDLLWKVFSAVKKSTKEEASVFLFEKKSADRHSKNDREVIVEVLRRGVQQLTKLRHPRILSVIHPLEETREALAFATEPVFACLSNVLGNHDNITRPTTYLTEFQLYEVEIKHGMLQLLEGLGFLHNDAKMMHGNMCPQSIMLAKTGTWKLAGCEFVKQASDPQAQNSVFRCDDWSSDIPREAQPNLDFLAPEYELTHRCCPASDMFSFGMLIYALYNKGKPLHECFGELGTFHRNAKSLNSIGTSQMSSIPPEIVDHIKLLLNTEPTVRPDALQMSKIPFFEDMACLTLQYMDTLFQRDNMEKSNFFKGLPKIIERLPKRVNHQRILPALFKECANHNMVPFILPSVFLISEASTTEEYQALVLPELYPLFKIREPVQVMLMFLQNMSLLLSKTPAQQIQTYVFPLIFSSLEANSPQIQELCLNIIPTFSDLIEYTTLKNSLVPRIKKLCLSTSILNVRVNALLCIGKLMDQMDRWYVMDEILPFLQEIPTREPAVLMSILGIHKVALSEAKLGITKDAMATKILPFIIPLSIDSNLNLSQFNSYISLVKEMLSKVETEHRTKLEQLDQIQQEHKTIEIGKVTGESVNSASTSNGKSSFMDKFLYSTGLAGGSASTETSTPKSVTPAKAVSVQPSTTSQPTVTAASPKKVNLTMEEKLRLAKQQEQERTLKAQKPLTPKEQSSVPKVNNESPTLAKMAGGTRDLTSTLMQSNVKNLSMSNKMDPTGTGGGGPSASSGFSSPSGGNVKWNMGSSSSGSSAVNWGSTSHSPSPQYGNTQSSLTSSTPSASSNPRVPLDLSGFESLLASSSSSNKKPMNMMGQSPSMQPIATPNQPSTLGGYGGMQAGAPMSWGNRAFPSVSMGPSQQVGGFGMSSGFPQNPPVAPAWGGQSSWGMMGQPGTARTSGDMGVMPGLLQPTTPAQQSSTAPPAATTPLTNSDLQDLLG